METRHRLTLAAAFAISPILPLAIRLSQLQVMQHEHLDSKAAGQFERSTKEIIPRADILDRDGKMLAHSVPSWSCYVDKGMVKSVESAARELSPLVALPAPEIARKLRKESRFAWIKTGMTFEEMSRLSAARIDSVGIVAGQERVYPNDDLARGVLGVVGADGHGGAGLELYFDKQLTGRARRFDVIRDGSGHMIYKNSEGDAGAPAPLRLTIDRGIQYYAEEALKQFAEKFSARSGMVAVQDPNNGEILAMAAYPADPLRNPLVQDSYEPGSTFKLVAAAAAIAESVVAEGDQFFCENGKYEISPGNFIRDHEPSGNLNLSGIIERSSNIGIAKVAERIGPMLFYRYSRAFGFANKTGITLPGETAGTLKPVSDLNRIALASSSYGYSVGVSALQLLGAYSAIANGGTLWEPTIIKDGRKPEKVRRVADPKTIARLTAILERVVETGTGVTAQVPGYRVAGKTGTAKMMDHALKKYSANQYTASFAGFVPASRPQFTILVVIDDPKGQYYGAQVSAPVFAKLAREILALKGVPPDGPVLASFR